MSRWNIDTSIIIPIQLCCHRSCTSITVEHRHINNHTHSTLLSPKLQRKNRNDRMCSYCQNCCKLHLGSNLENNGKLQSLILLSRTNTPTSRHDKHKIHRPENTIRQLSRPYLHPQVWRLRPPRAFLSF